ncbi:MAG: tetratricopeptide repeat protein [Anaeromyxobacter sp.]
MVRFPTDPQAADAAKHAGDLAYTQKRWREAFIAYGFIYKNAIKSDLAPDAMLGMGNAMLEQDDLKADAPEVYQELIQKFPKSKAAGQARTKLAELGIKVRKPQPSKKK